MWLHPSIGKQNLVIPVVLAVLVLATWSVNIYLIESTGMIKVVQYDAQVTLLSCC